MVALCRVQVVLIHVVDTLIGQLSHFARELLRVLEGEVPFPADLLEAVEGETMLLEKLLTKYDAIKSLPKESKFLAFVRQKSEIWPLPKCQNS